MTAGRKRRTALPSLAELPDESLARASQIIPGFIPISTVTLWRWCRDGRFPKPNHVNGVPLWRVGDVRDWQRRQLSKEQQ